MSDPKLPSPKPTTHIKNGGVFFWDNSVVHLFSEIHMYMIYILIWKLNNNNNILWLKKKQIIKRLNEKTPIDWQSSRNGRTCAASGGWCNMINVSLYFSDILSSPTIFCGKDDDDIVSTKQSAPLNLEKELKKNTKYYEVLSKSIKNFYSSTIKF